SGGDHNARVAPRCRRALGTPSACGLYWLTFTLTSRSVSPLRLQGYPYAGPYSRTAFALLSGRPGFAAIRHSLRPGSGSGGHQALFRPALAPRLDPRQDDTMTDLSDQKQLADYRMKNRVRFVTAASLFDGHDASINIMRRILQSRGAEVIHLGHNRSVREVVDCALQED